jgi:electron transfer flavoprotein alpha subunit
MESTLSTTQDIWAVVETDSQGRPRRLGLELASMAAKLAQANGGQGGAIVIGPREAADAVAAYGPATVTYCADARCRDEAVTPAAATIAALIQQQSPRLVLFPATPNGKDWAGWVAGKLGCGIEANAANVEWVDGQPQATLPVFSGALNVRSTFTGDATTGLLSILPGSFTAEKRDGASAQVQEVAVPGDAPAGARVVDRVAEQGGVPDLAGATVIVAAGRGVGKPENLDLVRDLAAALGGALGATRAIVDQGWIPYAYQIGQTGKTVKPKLYVAVGISGEIQHKVGMATSGTIVAINNNPEAPIMQFADLAVVGDLFQIVPPLTAEIRRRKGQ